MSNSFDYYVSVVMPADSQFVTAPMSLDAPLDSFAAVKRLEREIRKTYPDAMVLSFSRYDTTEPGGAR